jgi:hypothetical protein
MYVINKNMIVFIKIQNPGELIFMENLVRTAEQST